MSGYPERPAEGDAGEPPKSDEIAPDRVPSGGDGSSSGIVGGANGGGMERQLENLIGVLSTPKKASVGDRLKDLGHHVGQEKASVGVSINTHHAD